MSMAKKIKIAQIGIGHDHALPTFRSLLKQKDIFDVVDFMCRKPREGERRSSIKNLPKRPR